jgi:hypothetical protein
VWLGRTTTTGQWRLEFRAAGTAAAGHAAADVAREHGLEHGLEAAREHGVERGPQGERGAARYFGSAVEHGEPAGRWGGRGLAGMFGAAGVEAGAEASEDVVRAVFGRLQDPTSGESLGRAPRQFKDTAERVEAALAAAGPDATPEQRRALELAAAGDGRRAVAYYDLTFSPARACRCTTRRCWPPATSRAAVRRLTRRRRGSRSRRPGQGRRVATRSAAECLRR